jgi:hypothetical protein
MSSAAVKRPEVVTSQAEPGDAIAFEGSAEDAIRYLEGDRADETIRALRAEGVPFDDDPVLLALARAPLGDPETPEERTAVDEARADMATGGRRMTHEQVIASARAHYAATRA